jgi:serine O-acetyltransferase
MIDLLLNQLNYFGELNLFEIKIVKKYFDEAIIETNFCQEKISKERQTYDYFNSHYSMLFLYKLSHLIFINETEINYSKNVSEKLYLLNRMLNGLDLYYKIKMPKIFLIGHGLGTVFSNATYSENLVVYQNVTIGVQNDKYPIIEKDVIIYPNCTIAGDCIIGENSVIGSGCTLINKSIPKNTICYIKNGSLLIKENLTTEIRKYFLID